MNKQTGAIVVSILFAVGTAAVSYAADTTKPVTGQPLNTEEQKGAKSPAAPDKAAPAVVTPPAAPAAGVPLSVVTGELIKIDGKNYVVKDQSGKEVTFQLDERTRMNAQPKVGDKIRVQLEPQGYAYSINMASDSEQAGTPPLAKSDLPQPDKK